MVWTGWTLDWTAKVDTRRDRTEFSGAGMTARLCNLLRPRPVLYPYSCESRSSVLAVRKRLRVPGSSGMGWLFSCKELLDHAA